MPPLLFSSTDSFVTGAGLLNAFLSIGSLVLLEAVLSADNAVALAGIVSEIQSIPLRSKILNQGLVLAFLLRALTIVFAMWIIRYDIIRTIGGLYLVWLSFQHFHDEFSPISSEDQRSAPAGSNHWQLMGLIACTDLAFSVDSVSAAVAMCDNTLFVLAGGAMGVIMLRFLAEWMVRLMVKYQDLGNAAYLTVLFVGLRMLAHNFVPSIEPSQGFTLCMMAILFGWGLIRRDVNVDAQSENLQNVNCIPVRPVPPYGASNPGKPMDKIPVLTSKNTARL